MSVNRSHPCPGPYPNYPCTRGSQAINSNGTSGTVLVVEDKPALVVEDRPELVVEDKPARAFVAEERPVCLSSCKHHPANSNFDFRHLPL